MKSIEKTSIVIAFAIASILFVIKFNSSSTPATTVISESNSSENTIKTDGLGAVSWHRDLKKAQQLSIEKSKPILVLFQNNNDCSVCNQYGKEVLSNKGIVDAIEYNFIPLVILSSTASKDMSIQKLFNEMNKNQPSIRIVDAKNNQLTNPITGLQPIDLIDGMLDALDQKPEPLIALQKRFKSNL